MQQSSALSRVLAAIGGVVLIGLGLYLVFNSAASVSVIILLLCTGLILAGVLRLPEALQASDWRPVHICSALLLVLAGFVLLFWRSASLPILALLVSLTLLVGGALRVIAVVSKQRKASLRGVLTTLTGVFGSVLVIFWPRLSLWVVGVAFGAWLVLVGIRSIAESINFTVGALPGWITRVGRAGLTIATACCLVIAVAGGVVTAWLHAGSNDAVSDEFYLPPASVPDQPGQLLRSEPLEQQTPEASHAWRILYTTTLADGSPAVASGVVTVPDHSEDKSLPVISWANGTKGIMPRCAPSLSENPYEDGPNPAREQILADGWAVVTSDYVGLGTSGPHPYLVGESEAHAVLDATRAAAQLDQIRLSEQTVLWGHSQGGHAALFSAAKAKDYAPELEVLGVAAMAPASDLTGLAAGIKDSAAGKVVTTYIAGSWNEIYPELKLTSSLSSVSHSAVNQISALCFSGKDVLTALAASSQLFDPVINESALVGPIGDRLRENTVPTEIPVPAFISQGTSDSLVLPEMQRKWQAGACAAGSDILYREYDGLEHLGLVGASSPLNDDVVQWTNALLAGKQPQGNCAS